MTNRQLTKIVNLYQEGVSSEVCIAIIMDLTKDSTSLKKGTWIHKFYENIIAKKGSVTPKLVMISEKNDSILDGREDYKIINKEDKEGGQRMKTKFTPGPWIVGKGSFIITKEETENTLDKDSSLKYYEGYLICESVHKNNLDLISIAPELYNVLQEAVDEEESSNSGKRVYALWFEKAKLVLAKARGEEVE